MSVPVTTVPNPFTENTRSMGKRKWPRAFFSGAAAATRASSRRSSPRPAPVVELTGTIGAPSRNDPATISSISKPHQAEQFGIGKIGLGERDDPARHFEQAADIEVLAGLRLDGFIGGDDEQHQVDAAHAGQHVLYEALVAGDIHESQKERRRQLEMRKPKIDGDAAALFFLQAVGVDACQSLHQRGLAVIDMSRGADNDVLHAACYSVEVLAWPLLALVLGSLVYCVLTDRRCAALSGCTAAGEARCAGHQHSETPRGSR